MSGKWERLGEQFGLPRRILNHIRTQYPNPADGMKELIKVWLQQDYHRFSLRGLLTWIIVRYVFNEEFVGCIEPENTTYLQFQQILYMRTLSDSSKNFLHRTNTSKHPCALHTVVHLLYRPACKTSFSESWLLHF